MSMKSTFLVMTGLLITLNVFGVTRADTLLYKLSIEEKVAMLFVVPDTMGTDTLRVGNTHFDSYKVFDTRSGFSDSLEVDFPNENTMRSVTSDDLRKSLYCHLYEQVRSKGYEGIIVPDSITNIDRLYIGQHSLRDDHYLRVVDFPDALLAESMKGDHDDSSGQSNLLASKINLWPRGKELSVSLDDIIRKDVLFWECADKGCREQLLAAIRTGAINEQLIDDRVSKLLNYNIPHNDSINQEFINVYQVSERYKAYQSSISLYQKAPIFPYQQSDFLSITVVQNGETDAELLKGLQFYAPNINVNDSIANLAIYYCDTVSNLSDALMTSFTNARQKRVLLYAGDFDKQQLEDYFTQFDVVVSMPEKTDCSKKLLIQAMFGGFRLSGKSLLHNEFNSLSYKHISFGKSRLGKSLCTFQGLNPDSIQKVDSIIYDAIRKKAMPGAQLLVVKGGDIILDKAYGHHSYSKKKKVSKEDLYDVASITKLAVTFPLVMQLYEEGTIDLDAEISQYLPALDTTDKKDITIRELLLHQSGLISYIPFHYNAIDRESLKKRSLYSRHYSWLYNIRVDTRLYQNKKARFRSDVFASKKQGDFTKEVTANLFMNHNYIDTMYNSIYSSPLRKDKSYRYSDLGYYILQRIIEQEKKMSFDSLFDQRIASRLGANKLVYTPLKHFDRNDIVPTENDLGFRKELLDGYVHDQGAAMMGGVAAHAGLFANAGDLAKLAQMLMFEGKYGEERFVKAQTIGLFNRPINHGNRRGMGVDKPDLNTEENSHVSKHVSASSFGHTGFTGTILWIDPEYDLIYIFLSNRIHPRSFNKKLIEMNVRTQIQDVIYNSLNL